MARFISVQTLPAVASQDEVVEAGKALANGPQGGAQWLRSWLSGEDGRLFSEWEAAEEGRIRSALERAKLFPLEALYPVDIIEPAWFRAQTESGNDQSAPQTLANPVRMA